ncbi:hypothetical protein [Nostoc sp. WHI]|uniref:hypothetical protein n=1 Tax=Nostoc sp. WHI TaxID=2650611 RepID=UPI0018C53DF0|nr:hypothetical protein [Nostoc sp. WHI]MBG1267865.1 hypothetical protein [Nostoc sp. WHI]
MQRIGFYGVQPLWQSKQKITQTAIANIAEISQEWVSRFTQRWGGWQHFKKLLLLLLDSLNSGSNKNLADLDEDEKWLARTYFPMLIAESESSPDHLLESVAEVVQVFGTRAMRRVLHRCSPAVRADLLMTFFRCLPTEVYSISVSSISGSLAETALSPRTVIRTDSRR